MNTGRCDVLGTTEIAIPSVSCTAMDSSAAPGADHSKMSFSRSGSGLPGLDFLSPIRTQLREQILFQGA